MTTDRRPTGIQWMWGMGDWPEFEEYQRRGGGKGYEAWKRAGKPGAQALTERAAGAYERYVGELPPGVTVAPGAPGTPRERIQAGLAMRALEEEPTPTGFPARAVRWGTVSEGGWDYQVGYDEEGKEVSREPLGRAEAGYGPPGEQKVSITDTYGNMAYWNERTGSYDYPPGWGKSPTAQRAPWQEEEATQQQAWEQRQWKAQQAQQAWQQQWAQQEAARGQERWTEERAWEEQQYQEQQAWQQQQWEAQQAQQAWGQQWQQQEATRAQQQWQAQQAWQQQQAGTAASQWQQQQAATQQWQQQQLGWQREQAGMQQAEMERQEMARLSASPTSWLQYAAYTGEQPAIQPWMLPLMPQQYQGLQAGGAIPGWTPESGAGMPQLTRPSAQQWSRMGPTAQAQQMGYRQARTGIRPEEQQFRRWGQAPPGGRWGGLTRAR